MAEEGGMRRGTQLNKIKLLVFFAAVLFKLAADPIPCLFCGAEQYYNKQQSRIPESSFPILSQLRVALPEERPGTFCVCVDVHMASFIKF